ncbi:hypothetical protein BPOR_1079g00020 [Botrytis porri]|uniref:Uncharacterized protein n=1 Tax=Botrytis porri TaxID=87229 RepID=A0A4Z1KDL7_9HELO|nr:hypothetical protein BPOR_1079g00020 [Botrytis porri]
MNEESKEKDGNDDDRGNPLSCPTPHAKDPLLVPTVVPPTKPFKYIEGLPLHWDSVSGYSITEKLRNMRAALHSGADPNALDKVRRPEQSMERPLHYATDVTHFDFMPRYENLPILELLEFGADPRMKGMAETRESPLREVRRIVETNYLRLGESDMKFLMRLW